MWRGHLEAISSLQAYHPPEASEEVAAEPRDEDEFEDGEDTRVEEFFEVLEVSATSSHANIGSRAREEMCGRVA